MKNNYYAPGQHNFECMVCRGWFKSPQKRIRWDNSIVCKECWDPEPWFMKKIPHLPNELAPVRNSSPQAPFTHTINGITWDADNTFWNFDLDNPIFDINWED